MATRSEQGLSPGEGRAEQARANVLRESQPDVPASEHVLIWGGGGHGRVLADVIRALGHQVAGYVDGDPAKFGTVVEPGGARVVMAESALLEGQALPAGVTSVALGIGHNGRRLELQRAVAQLPLLPWTHPSAVVSPSARLGAATVVFPGAIINAAATVGAAVIVNSGAIIEHDCQIGDGAHISPRAVLAGGARVGALAWVGAGAVLLPGVSVGTGAIVGAGSVVLEDVEAGTVVVGNPARLLRRL